MISRTLDIVLCLIAGIFLLIPGLIICVLVKITSRGPVIYWSDRIGKNNKIFSMPKFRTMRIDTPQVATHLLGNGRTYLTPIGSFLRKSSMDEIPQLISVFSGDMGLVGPRPALFNQDDLIKLRTSYNIHTLSPGVTGWAQINGRDELSIEEKVKFDKEYLGKKSLIFDIKILVLTVYKVFFRANISH
ncbi:MAG TPA: sugar transferase [Bacteriovoracaceae bacterium]|nr:sugar transferase [Bacteriovoracaceae bacterium]